MKKLITTLTLLLMFSSPSYAEWIKVGGDSNETFYVDVERIRIVDGFVYLWVLVDLSKTNSEGNISYKAYNQGDCKLFRYKILSYSYYTQPMGVGTPSSSSNKPDTEWRYPPPQSPIEYILKPLCNR